MDVCICVWYNDTYMQHIPHVHFHVVPKPTEKEGLVFDMERIQEMWPMRQPGNEKLAETAARMKENLEKVLELETL